jgi:hypothetical protein
MKYYKIEENGNLRAIGTGYGGTEITEAEYNELLTVIREKAALVDSLYNEEITIDSVPIEWQEEIQRRVNERIEMEGTLAERDISADEALDIILGGEA